MNSVKKIQNIIDFIRKFNINLYPNNSHFKSIVDKREYNIIGNNYINILEQKFNSIDKDNNNIMFNYNDFTFKISFYEEEDEIIVYIILF